VRCHHQFINAKRTSRKTKSLYQEYVEHKQTYAELSKKTGKSISTLQRCFNQINITPCLPCLDKTALNLIFDATFFSRIDGVLVFRANRRNLHWRFIHSESLKEIALGLDSLEVLGYRFKSFTIDGRKGVIQLLNARYSSPIQLCHFHQIQIVRRYTTIRSLKTNLPYLFTYLIYPDLTIPHTTNSCDGSFAHWKQKVKIHRGISQHRRNQMINYLLSNS
jgi:hypothetical protein